MVKPGYKQTEVGVIPEDWEVVPLESLCEPAAPICYGIVQVGRNVPGGVPVVAIKHLDGRFGDELHLCDSRIESGYARSRVQAGDVLISIKGTIGRVGVVPSGFIGNISRDLARLRPSRSTSGEYLAQQLSGPPTRTSVEAATVGTTRLELSIATLRKLPALCPPPKEQRAIAEALSDADALIESLEALIAKKRQIKQGAMQELLTGKRRLPGFSGEWETRRLGQLADIRSGGTPATGRPEFWDGDVPWCTPTDITRLADKYLTATERTISALGLSSSSAELLPPGTVVMTSRATIGECALTKVPLATNQGFKNFVCNTSCDAEFLYYLLQTETAGFIRLCGGSTFLEIGKRQLVEYEIEVPPNVEEQRVIAAVLSDLDAELEALEAKLHKARAIKQGMMQELLTGRTRLMPAEVS